jgi:hypothetical protein
MVPEIGSAYRDLEIHKSQKSEGLHLLEQVSKRFGYTSPSFETWRRKRLSPVRSCYCSVIPSMHSVPFCLCALVLGLLAVVIRSIIPSKVKQPKESTSPAPSEKGRKGKSIHLDNSLK